MPNDHTQTYRRLAVIQETRTAIYLIQEGLISLNRLSGANDFAHLPVLLLSNGFERLLKMIWCLHYLEQQRQFPDPNTYDKNCKHHRLTKLLTEVVSIARTWDYSQRCEATRSDMEFIENDTHLQRIVELLEGYADKGRYYNLDVIIGKTNSPNDDPVHLFDCCCDDIFFQQPDWRNKVSGNNLGEKIEDNLRYINRQLTRILQRFARALCRMFTLGQLGQTAQQMTRIIGSFLYLRDEDLDTVRPRWFES